MTSEAPADCISRTVDFILLKDDPQMAVVEDDIASDLAKIGIKVNTVFLDREAYIERERNGNFTMLFTRTWGAPYDPHSYLTSWEVPSHTEYSVIGSMEAPLTRSSLLADITDVQTEQDKNVIQEKWAKILNDIHQQAMFLPLWGTRIPYVVNRRLVGFTPSPQAFTYPLESVRVVSGSTTVTVAPGSGGSLFSSAGPMNPHQYFPNQLFVSGWVYEGLVSYGQDGEIVPALASTWREEGLQTIFTLREGVKFHDGSDWNCTVAKLNFDHVLSETVAQRHFWYGTPKQLKNWFCDENDHFVLETNDPFYPLLQELTYTRPLVFASAESFAQGLDSHPDLHNSCNPGDFGSKWEHLEANITCAGLSNPIGTGPFKFVSRETNAEGDVDNSVEFARHDQYWGAVPEIEVLKIVNYESTEQVEDALLNGELDMSLGVGPLSSKQVQDLKFFHSDKVDVRHSDVLQHALLVLNTNAAPTDDISVRKAIIHAIDKGRFINDEFAGLEEPVYQLLPETAPFCNVELNPKWSFDLQKAQLINCPEGDGPLPTPVIAGIAGAVGAVVALVILLCGFIQREKNGNPFFTPSKDAVHT